MKGLLAVMTKFTTLIPEEVSSRGPTDCNTSFLYSGDMNTLIQRLSRCKVNDLSISEPDLEEIFLHYYEKEGGAL